MFHVIEKDLRWRRENKYPEGFESLRRYRPLVAVGAEKPSGNQMMMADYFRTFRLGGNVLDILTNEACRWEGRTWWSSYQRKTILFPYVLVMLRDISSQLSFFLQVIAAWTS